MCRVSAKHYPEEFKLAAVRQITEGGYAVSDTVDTLDSKSNYFAHASGYLSFIHQG